MPEYTSAPDVAAIAETLIAQHHSHLDGIRVEFVFRDKAAKKNGKEVGGTARKVTGLNAFLARDGEQGGDYSEDFFVIEIAEDIWTDLTPHQKRALVDHELMHCTIELDEKTDALKLGIRGHDIEEFAEIVQRHGVWSRDLVDFAAATKEQLDLFHDASIARAS